MHGAAVRGDRRSLLVGGVWWTKGGHVRVSGTCLPWARRGCADCSFAESSPADPQDLAVKKEGRFVLRYRAFNIQSKTRDDGVVSIMAECFGGAFEVYSTKSFPGLQASTELTRVSFISIRLLAFHSVPI